MAHSLATLPSEIVDQVLCHCSADDLARARLVSSRFREPASRLLFRQLILRHTSQSATNVASIIAPEDLRAFVREFVYLDRTSHVTNHLYEFPDCANSLPAQVLHTLHRVSLLDNLTVLRCSYGDRPRNDLEYDDWVAPSHTDPGETLKTLIVGLAERGATSRKLEDLAISNLPCQSQPDLTDHPSFSALLRTLRTLYLTFDYRLDDVDFYWSRTPCRHREFFTRLPQAWLAPASHDLTCLDLGASELWGYLLKVDFRGVHFPRLKSLVMKNFVFSHDWQLDWILSHTSLQGVCLLQCWILTHAHWYGEEDNEGYPIRISLANSRHDYHYAKSWHHYYQHFSSFLGNLRWFTTMRDDEWAKTDWVGGYETYSGRFCDQIMPEPDRRAEDEEALKHLKATTYRRSRQCLANGDSEVS